MVKNRWFLAVAMLATLILVACSGAIENSVENPAPVLQAEDNVADQTSFAGTQAAPPFPTGLD